MRLIKYLFLLAIVILGISFALLNAEKVQVNFYIGVYSMPLSLILLISLVIGIFVGFIVGLSMYIRQRHINYKLRKRIKIADEEIANLRTMPVKDIHT